MMNHIISGKQIVIGVCGGIAAYKSVELMRLFQKAGANVRVVMTKNAASFVAPLTFEAISGQPVFLDMFEAGSENSMRHISWADEADAVVIAPATANMIGKLANGIADDALSTLMLVATCSKFICPSMNTHMYENRAVQRNLDMLQSDGHVIVEPGEGELACGAYGPGRLADPEYIFQRVVQCFYPKDFKGKKVLVTAGPTREPIDPVRFISNPSSGKMGYALAEAAAARGAGVTLVAGPTGLSDPIGVNMIKVQTAMEMADAVFGAAKGVDVIIKVAAVSDYRPVEKAAHKIKKDQDKLTLSLERTQDILAELGRRKKRQVLVGFAAETRDLEKYALKKLKEKNLDMIAGNIVG
ncbi:MAG: bifunctional phosphopantothenoylcysteine decarboxylase/phosphopantothenate--cysteine ligase CoaBC [Desulfobacterales bacterium]|nr:bifunctional phosphopantothenoylcysteine decarboxylase/phosphopantothenate--cysteine ligase CoaBC [Desulfobacterales bacterium]